MSMDASPFGAGEMQRARRSAARAEWRANWPLVLAATVGMSITGRASLFAGRAARCRIAAETGWSRTEITLGQTMSSGINAFLAPLCGVLMDRYGPRRIAIPGTILYCLALAAFASVGHSLLHWYAMWGLLSIGLIGLKPNVWTGAVSGAFTVSRALAFALVISGVSLAGALVPSITNLLLEHHGWRGAYVGLAMLWAAMLLPLCLLFQRWRRARGRPASDRAAERPGLTVREGLRSRAFARLAIAGFVFSVAIFAVTFHFVPMLRDRGIDAASAAAIAGLIGIFSIVGRLITGVLLDRYSGALIGGVALLLPIIPVALLLLFAGGSPWLMTLLAILIGLSVGSELDILAYLATRHFGLRYYGTLFGCIVGVLAAATALGPVLGSAIRDRTGSYDMLLWLTIPGFAIAALAIATAGRYPEFEEAPPVRFDPE